MDLQKVVVLAGMTGVFVAVYLGLRALSLKFGAKRFKKPLRIFAVLGPAWIAITAFTMYSPDPGSATFKERVPGPARGSGSVTREIDYYVNDSQALQVVELKLLAYPETQAAGVLPVRYRVSDPAGKELVQGEQQVSPAAGIEWAPARFSFTADRDGAHKIIVEIPQGADMLSVQVKPEQ